MQNEFNYTFQVTRMVIFEVSYETIGGNKSPYFSTSAAEFNRPKTDFNRCGQAQKDLLPSKSKAGKFWRKWDIKHLQLLTDSELAELERDIEGLKAFYNWIPSDRFARQRELSLVKPKDGSPAAVDPFAKITATVWNRGIVKKWGADMFAYSAVLTSDKTGEQVTASYYAGLAHKDKPTKADILGAMIKDAQAARDYPKPADFQAALGYDCPREALRIFDECQQQAYKLERLGLKLSAFND